MDNFQERRLADVPLVVLDTETTGLSPETGHRIIEIAALRLEQWQEVARIDQLLNPGRPIDPGASRVNGIYDHEVADAPPFSDVSAGLRQLLDGAVVVAHNARFDAAFIGMEYAILNYGRSQEAAPTNPWLCTLQLARRCFYFGRNNLANVARSLGVRTGRAHRALNDAYTTLEVFKRMVRHLNARRLHSVGDFLQAQGGAIHTPSRPKPYLPPAIAAALSRHQPVTIRYRVRGRETERTIQPLYPTQNKGHVYVVAYCHLRRSQRTFRLDRIVHATLVTREND